MARGRLYFGTSAPCDREWQIRLLSRQPLLPPALISWNPNTLRLIWGCPKFWRQWGNLLPLWHLFCFTFRETVGLRLIVEASDSSRLQFVQFARLVQTPEAWNGGKVVRLVGLRWPKLAQTLGFVKFIRTFIPLTSELLIFPAEADQWPLFETNCSVR